MIPLHRLIVMILIECRIVNVVEILIATTNEIHDHRGTVHPLVITFAAVADLRRRQKLIERDRRICAGRLELGTDNEVLVGLVSRGRIADNV